MNLSANIKLSKYRQTEKWLYTFPVNLLRLHEAVLELRSARQETDCHAQSYESVRAAGTSPSDPVAAYNSRIDTLAKYVRGLSLKTTPILIVRGQIKNSHDEREREMFCVMELYYFEHRKVEDVAVLLQKSAKTLSRRRHELVERVIEEREREMRAIP